MRYSWLTKFGGVLFLNQLEGISADRVAISTVPDLSGSGRVDMLTRPVAAARAAVATGALG